MPKSIDAVKYWLEQVVIGLNFCPFAKKVYLNEEIFFFESNAHSLADALVVFAEQCQYLLDHPEFDTTLILFPTSFIEFNEYLMLVDEATYLLDSLELNGIFQIASFHPHYCFEGVAADATENFTNRSPYPMLHLIREHSIDRVLATFVEPEMIPVRNIALAEQKGRQYFEQILHQAKHLHCASNTKS